ncbi:hypothetical protein RISK_000563 [Rhodopirellula islandica]|uniref:Uncharacterized protein n=1 Tax=Rhodopirellula islandica TaxID=595434 RepID=A0A0J1BLX6_RHOIS|nr:hypothetical protein [Rhodopirellula islandica]KLU07485.1 hypothetical protein RISK_000563 [Rhodopirellula islandica]
MTYDDDVIVRYHDEMTFVNATVEGELPTATIQSLAADRRSKLARVENWQDNASVIDESVATLPAADSLIDACNQLYSSEFAGMCLAM